jgi:hypothetical protein
VSLIIDLGCGTGRFEPIDLFGDAIVPVDRLARIPKCSHPVLEVVIGE